MHLLVPVKNENVFDRINQSKHVVMPCCNIQCHAMLTYVALQLYKKLRVSITAEETLQTTRIQNNFCGQVTLTRDSRGHILSRTESQHWFLLTVTAMIP